MSITVRGKTVIGSNIITDGLVLFLDSKVSRSYPGTGTVWYDMSGNGRNHTIVGSPTYSNGEFSMASTNKITYSGTINHTTCTVVLFYKTTDIAELWVMGNTTSYYLSASNNNTYYHAACGSPTNYVDLNVISNPYASGYKDGGYHMWEAKNVDFSTWTIFEWFGYPDPWFLNSGALSNIIVYNKVLSATESQQNFNAFKNRFGI